MTEPSRKHELSQDEEKSFAETLVSEHSPIEALPQAPAQKAEAKPASKQPPWVGKVMGHFRLLRLIGEGAMGMVIQAEDTGLRRLVALKVLRKQLSTGEKGKKAIEQFLREARAAAAIEHPNIVRVFEINQHAGWWYIAMEMVEGNSLQEIVKATGSLPASRACPIIADAALGLQAAHELGMIHRDIKPGNILVTRNGRGKLTDFGLVRMDDPNDPDDAYAHKSIGTPLYMAPEVIRRQSLTPAVDIYSLGATLYYTLTGCPPYSAEKMEDILDQHLHKAPPDLQEYLGQSSPTLANLIQRMMAKEPGARPTAAEVAATLHAEAISFYPDTAGLTGAGGSSVGTNWQGLQHLTKLGTTDGRTRTVEAPSIPGLGVLSAAVHSRKIRVVIAAVVLLLCGLAFWLYQSRTSPDYGKRPVSSLFPDAPAGYGTRQAGSIPLPAGRPAAVPEFSWKGKMALPGCLFVASQGGRYYFEISDERALLIRSELCIGYETAEQAQKDGKKPAPYTP
jgi:serine/threonine protein kinase